MRIDDFAEKIAIRFDSKLNSTRQYDGFLEDCKNHLKKYEGEVLGFAYEEIIYQNRSRTHPTIANIRKVCNDKMVKEHKTTNPMTKERAVWIANTKIFDDYKSTDRFKWACQNMIGWDVELFISRKGVAPEREDIKIMMRAHEEFKKKLADLDEIRDPSRTEIEHWKMGNALNNKNLDYYQEHTD